MNAQLQPYPEILVGIGDVARFLDVPAHTLRFWEREFSFFLSPARTEGRQRRYDDDDIQRLGRIKLLLKGDGYSIAGAKRILQKEQNPGHNIYSLLSEGVNTYIEPNVQMA
jgi:DNA-binding transcriptional MerR regulator